MGNVVVAYAAATDPVTKAVHWDIIQRLRGQLGMTEVAAPAEATGDGDGDSDDATE